MYVCKLFHVGVEIPPPSREEIKVAFMLPKNNKAAGLDGFPAELFKTWYNELVGRMRQLICEICLEDSIPND